MKVLLVHGLGRTPLSMLNLAGTLRSQDHSPEFFGYASWAQSYDQIVQSLQTRLKSLAQLGPYAIVTHSLGGILCRSALAPGHTTGKLPHQVVMLAPPNQPPRLGAIAWKVPLFRWFAQDCGHHLAHTEFYQTLPPLTCPYTIVAGTAGLTGEFSPFGDDINDGIVSVQETQMVERDRPQAFPVLHTFIMNDSQIQQFILEQLQ